MQDNENSLHKLSSHSKKSKENCEMNRKRKHSVTSKDDTVSKKQRIDVSIVNNEDSELSDLQDESRQDEMHNACQIKQYIPHHHMYHLHKQSSYSKSSSKENHEMSRKRRHSVTGKDNTVSKKQHMNASIVNNDDSELLSALEDKSRQNELHNACQTKQYIPYHLIKFMYQLDLSMLCSLRKSMHEYKYPSLLLAFGDSEIDQFNSIVIRYKKKSIHIKIENVDKYYIDNGISYARLFTKEKRIFFINNYFNSIAKHLISKSDSLSSNIEYLIIYTNSSLDLTEEKKLKKGRTRSFYPFKFDSIDMEECDILKDFLFTNDSTQGRGFYQFSQDKMTREELLNRLEFSTTLRKVIKERKLSQEFETEIKEAFLDKLVFAVNQPNREELNSIIKNEIEKNQDDYIALQERILHDLIATKEHKKLGPEILYEFNLLMLFLHDMFLHKNMLSISFEGKSCDTYNNITINYKDRITYVKAHNVDSNIGYSQLFPSRQHNKHFTFFIEELKKNIKYFIIYTNVNLDLTEEKILKKGRSKDFHPLKFDCINIQKKKYKILRDCSFINGNGLYQFAQEETTREKLLNLLKLPLSLQKEKEDGRLSNESEKEIKERFLDKLILAVNQPNRENLSSVIRKEINMSNVPYNYEELHEIALRWLESHKFGSITERTMIKLFEDIKNNKFTYQKIHNNDIEKAKFAKSIVGNEGSPAFHQFLDFLIKGEGRKYLEVLKRQGVNLVSMSSILAGSGVNAAKAFKDFYDLWFDVKGCKTQYLKALEEEGINLGSVSSILNGSGTKAPKAFEDLYNMWFDIKGSKTQYLKALEEEGISLINVSSILNGSGTTAPKAFKDLYDLWFDVKGNKTQYLKTLEEKEINIANISSIIGGSGTNAAKTFKSLYDLWFDDKGNKTQYLKTLEREGINLPNMSSILHRVGVKAPKAFKDLYDLWFDVNGNKTQYLKTLEENGINLHNMSSILHGSGANATKAFKDLYNLWFNVEENKTQYLKTLEEEGISLTNMSGILGGSGANAAKTFKDLYDLWFDVKGNRTQYLKSLEKEGINLPNISNILHRIGAKAPKAFKDLYDLWFDVKGNKTQYLKVLEVNEINLANISSILGGSGINAVKAFKDLYDLWFDEKGNKTRYLKTLEEKEINLTIISSILGGSGAKAPKAFKNLYNLWFDVNGNKTQYLKTLEEKEINLTNISSILHGSGTKAPKAFKDLYNLWFDIKGNKTQYLKTLEEKEINLTNISSILGGSGSKAPKAFKDLYDLWFDIKGNKTQYLKTLEEKEINLIYMSSILSGSGAKAPKAFKDLYDLWFDIKGNETKYLRNLEEKEINLTNMSSILHRAGANAAKAFKELYNNFFDDQGNKKQHLKHFIDQRDGKSFVPHNLSGILSGAGAKTKDAFEKLHNICFNDKGERTKYLDDFFKADFVPSNLSAILCGSGIHASSILKRLHSVCFNDKGERTELLGDFYKAGFRPVNLCSMLSGAVNSLENFHEFCFIGETKKYLSHFLNEEHDFTISNLSRIFHGARANICSALKDFHDICFDEKGHKTQLLADFYNAGFRPSNLSKILFMAGDNASFMLRNFHKSCFNKNHLNHFLAENSLFTPKHLSKILDRVGLNICPTFEKLHDICFDKAGIKKNYLNNLIRDNPPYEILDTLYKIVRKAPAL